jgi:protein-tyrosine kinase
MSRIEEALKRAAANRHGDGASTSTDGLLAVRRPENVETPLVPSWHFDRLPREKAEGSDPERPESLEPESPLVDPSIRFPTVASPAEPALHSSIAASMERRDDSATTARSTSGGAPWQGVFSEALSEKAVVMSNISGLSVEQYRNAAAALHQIQLDRGSKVVMVASAVAGEGKTLTAVNLALTLSESYRRRVLLVDADLRRPQMHEVFQIANGSGLNEGLQSSSEQRLSVVEISPRLVLLPAGRPDPDPMSVLTSDRMRQVIREAAAAFDWVILDTPPVVMLPDANLLADMVDLAVLVAAAGRTPYKMIARAVELIGRDRVAGVVLNGVDEKLVAAMSAAASDGRYGHPSSAHQQA